MYAYFVNSSIWSGPMRRRSLFKNSKKPLGPRGYNIFKTMAYDSTVQM